MIQTDWVSDSVIRAAISAGIDNPTLGSSAQWQKVEEYLKNRGEDPWPKRRLQLRDSNVSGAELLAWLAQDVLVAAPLLAAFTSHDTSIKHAVVVVDHAETQKVSKWLSEKWKTDVHVEHAEVIGGGFSRRMWRTELSVDGSLCKVIVRIEQGGMFGTNTATEVRTMNALHAVGFAVPKVLIVEEQGSILGEPFFVMEEVPGVVRLDDQGLDDVIRSISNLHEVPSSVLDLSNRGAEQIVHDNIEYWRSMYRQYSPEIPIMERSADWLHERLQPTGPAVIVHGDAGPGNALFDDGGGLTTIDWEFAHVGDPAEDWAYLALIRGRRTMDPDSWKTRLASIAGVEFSPQEWQNWLAFNNFRGSCVNLSARSVFEKGPHRQADQLAIGVAVHLRFLSQLSEITSSSWIHE